MGVFTTLFFTTTSWVLCTAASWWRVSLLGGFSLLLGGFFTARCFFIAWC